MRRFGMFALVLWATASCLAQKPIDWLPITQQDWQMNDAPGAPQAPAIQLYYSYYKDDNQSFVQVYRRIKVLRESGKKYATVEIEIEPEVSLKDLAARTIHPDGTIVDFKDKPFEKIIVKTRDVKYVAKTFALPDVSIGSIIEYKYTLGLPLRRVNLISTWQLQGDLYTVRADFRFRAYQGVVRVPTEWNSTAGSYSRVAYAYINQLDARSPEKGKENLMELHAENIPAFVSEEYMPPEDDFKPIVFFYYGGHEIASPDKYWEDAGRAGSVWIEKFIGNFNPVHDLAAQVIGSEADPAAKLRKLYARVQQIRNTSYERERSEEERKQEKLKDNQTALDVLNRGYGTSFDINALFAALARSAGFEADLLVVSDRRRMSFQRLVLSLEQFDSSAVQVKMNGKEMVLSPGTKYCPFGLLPWEHSSVTAMKFGKAGAEFITTPTPEPSASRRTGKMTLAADGSLTGEITLELNGQNALEHRLDALSTDEAGRRKQFEDELQQSLPQGAVVKLNDSAGWGSTDEPLIGHFTVEISKFASAAGKRLIAPSLLFPTFQKDMFTQESRTYPIIFHYPFTEMDEVDIELPEGYLLEATPFHRKAGLYYAAYETTSSLDDNQLITKRLLRLDHVSFPPEQYFELKNFFDVVKDGDEEQAVLRPAQGASAEK